MMQYYSSKADMVLFVEKSEDEPTGNSIFRVRYSDSGGYSNKNIPGIMISFGSVTDAENAIRKYAERMNKEKSKYDFKEVEKPRADNHGKHRLLEP